MACALTGSQLLDCKDSVGGIAEVKFKAHPGITVINSDFTVTSGTVAIASSSNNSWYTYGIEKETAEIESNAKTEPKNGVTWFEHVLKMVMNKLSTKLTYEEALLAKNRLLIAVKDMNGGCWLLGMKYGCDMTSASSNSGTARGDRSGYSWTFTGKEDLPIQSLSTNTYNALVS